MVQLHFDFRDLFRSARWAFSLQRMWIQFLGLAIGYVGYLIFTYLSFVVGGMNFSESWDKFGLLPCLFATETPWYSWIPFVIGCLVLLVAYLITNTAVSRASYMMLKGNNFYTWREAFGFALRKSGAVLLSPVAILIMIACFVIGAWVIGLLGKIPYVGELGLSLFTFFWLLAALFLVFLMVILAVSLILVPAIIATTDEDAFEAVFQTFSTAWSQPWRLILYEILAAALSLVGFFILAFVVKRAFVLMGDLFAFSMGDKFINLASHGQYLLQKWVFLSQDWLTRMFGETLAPHIYFSKNFFPLDLPGVLTVSSYIFAIFLVLAGGWVVSYPLATFSVGTTVTYLALRKKKDNENLLERKDKEEEEEEEEKKEEKEKAEEAKTESEEQEISEKEKVD